MSNLIKKESTGLEEVSFNDSLSEYEQECESYKQITSKVDLINRQAAIDVLETDAELLKRVLNDTDVVGNEREKFAWGLELVELFIDEINDLPSAEPKTKLIAEVKMSKEDIQNAVNEAVARIKAQSECKRGKWIGIKYTFFHKCSVCSWLNNVDSGYSFCPRCGSYNEGEQDEID